MQKFDQDVEIAEMDINAVFIAVIHLALAKRIIVANRYLLKRRKHMR